jgi:hypothetical protein
MSEVKARVSTECRNLRSTGVAVSLQVQRIGVQNIDMKKEIEVFEVVSHFSWPRCEAVKLRYNHSPMLFCPSIRSLIKVPSQALTMSQNAVVPCIAGIM